MLEQIPANGTATSLPPFQATDADGKASFDDCEDKGGISFRRDNWTRQCTHLCNEGSPAIARTVLSTAIRAHLRVAQLGASGKLLDTGFARGNFNYRHRLVGRSFRWEQVARLFGFFRCQALATTRASFPTPSQHNGPFFIRKSRRRGCAAMLFDGRIEHARGLASSAT